MPSPRALPLALLSLCAAGAAGAGAAATDGEEPAIVDTPITYDEERIALTVAYRRAHQDPEAKDQLIEPRAIVIHYTGGSSRKASFAYFDRVRIEKSREKQAAAGEVNVSAHFLVDRDGTIYRLMPETWMARHCIGLNHLAIGIENVGDGEQHPLTDAQLEANARLVRELAGRHPITHLLGHHEYRRMEGHAYFLELDPGYRNQKGDPGDAFMTKLRARVEDLGLEAPPPAKKKKPSKIKKKESHP